MVPSLLLSLACSGHLLTKAKVSLPSLKVTKSKDKLNYFERFSYLLISKNTTCFFFVLKKREIVSLRWFHGLFSTTFFF